MEKVLTTHRLVVRRAGMADAEFIHGLWTNPDVMHFVGFPRGLAISVDDVREQIETSPDSEFGSRLIAELLETGTPIGQCKLGAIDADGVCEPDIKLKPAHWGNGYGKELWIALVDYAFTRSSAKVVQGTPNRDNLASVQMQMGAGMVKVDEGVFESHTEMHPGAVPVPYYKLQITRQQWKSRRENQPD
ncbi:GNAT family N-acetyltransferase [Candidatus Bipolaricaulota bacterium]